VNGEGEWESGRKGESVECKCLNTEYTVSFTEFTERERVNGEW
jgi:hypothetical protein